MKLFLFLFIIFTLFIFNLPNIYAQGVPCIKNYNFENSASAPALTNDWEIVSGNPHTGQKSFKSQISDGRIRSFSIRQPGDKSQSVEFSFWSFSDEPKKGEKIGRLLVEFDGKQEFVEYTHLGEWKRFVKTIDGATDHTFKWTYFPGSGKDVSAWIDDICIRNTNCPDECPEGGATFSNKPTNTTAINTTAINITAINTTAINTTAINTTAINTTAINTTAINTTAINTTAINTTAINTTAINTTAKEYLVEKGIDRIPVIFPTIQSAVDYVPAGSVIIVRNMTSKGPYYEDIIIKKSLKLIGEDNAAIQTTGIACHIDADDVTVTGMQIKGGISGIALDNANRCNISYNTIDGCQFGIILNNVQDSDIMSNYLLDSSKQALLLTISSKNRVESNIINKATLYGINLDYSEGNNITGNTIQNIRMYGIYLNTSDENNIAKNNFLGEHEHKIIERNSRSNTIDMPCKDFPTGIPSDNCNSCD